MFTVFSYTFPSQEKCRPDMTGEILPLYKTQHVFSKNRCVTFVNWARATNCLSYNHVEHFPQYFDCLHASSTDNRSLALRQNWWSWNLSVDYTSSGRESWLPHCEGRDSLPERVTGFCAFGTSDSWISTPPLVSMLHLVGVLEPVA